MSYDKQSTLAQAHIKQATAVDDPSAAELAFNELVANQRALDDAIGKLAGKLTTVLFNPYPLSGETNGDARPGVGVPLCDAIWTASDRAIAQRDALIDLCNRLAI